ncbi:TonB-dependent receptor [Novosphingobium sp. 1949]|uniref:TonB-dependent receptor n=1 Tax=Novosphingobium organovorum TaxID=2930092 RepID=A0ABT0BCV2_9SPHN|nr:TonB-dependent receptor [Novosphingobium organovorum]MCJ2182907.1 TonB-dependent receptor [Novosphingobium organovorum]
MAQIRSESRVNFAIPAQSVRSAMDAFAQQTGIEVVYPFDRVRGMRTRPAFGLMTPEQALHQLLAGTGLKATRTRTGGIALSLVTQASLTNAAVPAMAYGAAGAADTLADAEASSPRAGASEQSSPIIVTGTRSTNRTVADSLAPIDVLSSQDLKASGKQSVRDLLGTLVPSINVSNGGAGASFAVKTLSLRGLSGDQLLVLVNGKRRHNSANIFINGSTQNGQSPPDLDLIPGNAVAHIEVLRDGASAQYGSDAIAGVINVILKDDTSGSMTTTGGLTWDGGGEQMRTQIDKGFTFGDGAIIHLTAEGYVQNNTRRSNLNTGRFYAYEGELYSATSGTADPREATVNRDVNRAGQPGAVGGNVSYNLVVPTGSGEFYSFATGSKRHANGWLTYRFPDASNNLSDIFPNGYTPHLHIYDTDYQVTAGFRGDGPAGIHYDLSSSYAADRVRFRETTTLNVSMGPDSPTDIYIGTLKNSQWTSNLDLSKEVSLGLAEPLQIAAGAEYRRDGFGIEAGEEASYIDGGYVSTTGAQAGTLRTAGSQGVTGFPTDSAGDWHRNAWSAYLDLEQTLAPGVDVALAGRHEDYSDFGTTNTGKASLRIEPVHGFALRGTASTGFRAPTLQQEHYSSASTISVTVDGVSQLLPVQALPVDSEAAIALGASPLKPEKSTNFSAGFVFTALPGFSLTADAYQITIKDRILLSSTLTGTTVMAVLAEAGITNSAGGFYFSNAADTRTRGLDVVATYRQELGGLGTATFNLSANFNKTVFTHVDEAPAELTAAGLVLIGRDRQGDYTKGTPRDKFIASVLWEKGPAAVNLRATRYGKVTAVNSSSAAYDAVIDPKVLFDLDVSYALTDQIKVAVGANNLFNTYPNELPTNLQYYGFSKYNAYSPYGVSGGFYYARLSFDF